MAARITDKKRKKIIADYVELGSYNATGKMNAVSKDTVRRIIQDCEGFDQLAQQKKEENTADILAYMEGKRDKVTEIIGLYLDELLDVSQFRNLSPNQLTTALGTLIDKWTMIGGRPSDTSNEDGLSQSLREMAEGLKSDD